MQPSTRQIGALAAAIITSLTAACGSKTPTSSGSGGGTHTAMATVMIEFAGPNPREITVDVGQTVSFMNHEHVPYTIAGGASPSQPGCPEVNAVGVVAPGEIRQSDPFSAAKSCDYHIRSGQSVAFSGRIIVR